MEPYDDGDSRHNSAALSVQRQNSTRNRECYQHRRDCNAVRGRLKRVGGLRVGAWGKPSGVSVENNAHRDHAKGYEDDDGGSYDAPAVR